MANHHSAKSPPARTYTARPEPGPQVLVCTRCRRVYPYPEPGSSAIRCECGWRYENNEGQIDEEFAPRLGV
jgi:LSD1 subclass zinc finger protein